MKTKKSKTLWRSCLFGLTLLLGIGSCKKDQREQIPGLSINDLKNWYSKQTVTFKSSMFASYLPDWGSSYTSSKDGYEITEITFSNPNKVAVLKEGSGNSDAEKDLAADAAQVKLLFFNQPGSSTISAAYMMLKGEGKQDVSNVHYKDFEQ